MIPELKKRAAQRETWPILAGVGLGIATGVCNLLGIDFDPETAIATFGILLGGGGTAQVIRAKQRQTERIVNEIADAPPAPPAHSDGSEADYDRMIRQRMGEEA